MYLQIFIANLRRLSDTLLLYNKYLSLFYRDILVKRVHLERKELW